MIIAVMDQQTLGLEHTRVSRLALLYFLHYIIKVTACSKGTVQQSFGHAIYSS